MLASSLAIALAGLASLGGAYAQVAAWHMDTLRTLVTARLDSVVSPNQVSSHMHQILGGSAFSAAYSFDALRASKCTTASISADRSNYWMPKLYWVNDDGSFIPIPGGSRFYYFLGRSSPAEPVHPFPEGLRMLQGNPNLKSDNGVSTFTCMVNADLSTGNIYADQFNFDRDCPYGLRIEVTFPNCWDGVNLYKDDGSHVVFPAGINQRQGSCPWSHPIRIPQIMLEYTWRPSAWAPGQALKGHLAWANGDTTGYGVHADFQNGWDTAVLAAALNSTQCAGELKSQPIQSCEVFAPLYNGNPQCTAERGTLDEPDMLHQDLVPIDHLPGCNPVWGASGSKPGCSTTMPSPNLAGWTGTQQSTVASGAQRKDLVLPTKPGWQQIGCLRDSGSMLTGGGGNYYDNALSVTTCTASCSKSGYNYAAIGMKDGRWDCQCGKGVDPNAGTFPGMCTSPCPGNSKEICGASSVHSVYYAPPGTAAPNASSVATGATGKGYLGCYYPAGDTSLSSKIKFSYTDSALTQEACLQVCANRNMTWAAMSAGRNCMCGTDASVGSGYYQSEASCNMGCAGNSTQMCGWTYGYSVYDVQASGTIAQTTQHPAGWKGCFSDPGMGGLTDFSWTSDSMTAESCSYGCAELGYSLSGLVFGSRCRCGNTWKGGPIYPATQCQIACPGNSSETCGGNYNTEVYDISSYATKVKADVAARPAGWLGCYANSAGVILKDTNTYDASNSVDRCKATCGTYGYAYTGVTNGYYCRCGNVSPNGIATRWPSNFFCGAQCPGNNKQTCGAANSYVDLYNTTTTAPGSGGSLNANPSGYQGCYAGVSGLNGGTFTMSTMTNKVCTTGCKEMGFALAGTSGNNCYCGNSWTTGDLLPDLRCTSKCAGNNTDTCGGYYITSLYNSTVGDTVQAKTEPGYLGCFTDSGSARALTSFSYSSSAMSNAVCKATCAGKGYSLSGTSAQYCYCGNQISNGQTQTTSALCTTPCLGAADRMCGGPGYKISIFNATATAAPSASASAGSGSSGPTFASGGYVQSRGCYSDVTVLDQATYTSGYMTIDQCMSHCKGQNYGFAGVLNGNQCRCGNSAPVVAAGRSLCATQCVSNSTQICGGNGYVDVWPTTQSNYFKDAYAATSADADGDFGCWQDANDRLIKGNTFSSNTNTPESCLANCYAQGYSFSGTEANNQCYCGNELRKGLIRYDKSVCSYSCAGDSTKKCGGWWAANVRVLPQNGAKPTTSASATSKASGSATGSVSKSSTASASATPSSAAIEGYKGCYAIGTFASSASSKTTGDGTMTINYCRRFCRDQGFANAGVQGGNNCYCGAMNTLGTKLPDSTCAIDCAGGGGKCGDVYMASMYDTTGAGALTKPDSPANFVGCFVDSNTRILPNYTFSSSVMTSDICRRTCSAKGLTVYGTQAGNQCFCGSTLPKTMVPDAQCGQACAGNQQEKCGGSWRMSVYSPDFQEAAGDTEESPVSSSASSASPSLSPSASMISNSTASASASSSASPSVTSSVIASASTSASPIPIASSSTSPAVSSSSVASSSTSAVSSSAAASSASSSLAESSASSSSSSAAFTSADDVATSSSSSSATSSASQTSSSSSAAASPSPSAAASSSASPSSSVAPTSSSAAATSSSAVPTSSATPSPSPSPSSSAAPSSVSSAAAPSATNHLGCFTQSSTAPVLKESVITCDTLTPGMCKLWCNSNNFAYAGMTNGTTCGCASDISALTSAPASQCSKDCFSDRSAKCGGEVNTFNVWKSSGLIARRAHRRFMRANHGASPRNQEPLHFNSEREILEYLKRQA